VLQILRRNKYQQTPEKMPIRKMILELLEVVNRNAKRLQRLVYLQL
jgi:hypothetical protein